MKKIIESYCGVCEQAFETLLDAYQMKDWEMTWSEFVDQFEKEIQDEIKIWKKQEIGVDNQSTLCYTIIVKRGKENDKRRINTTKSQYPWRT